MSVKQDVVNLLVNINGDSAKSKLNDLRKSASDIREELKGMKRGSHEYIAASAKLASVKSEMGVLKKEIGLTALSQRELNAELRRLSALKQGVAPFSKEFNQLQSQINAVKGRLTEVRSGIEGFRGVLAKFVPEVRGFGAVMLAAFAFQVIRRNITAFIQDLSSMSNKLADIQRVTGMAKGQVDSLDRSLKSLDTGTGVNQLRDLAIVAGKLGVANKDILSFVAATDKLVVALGDELGDADAITTNLGKIINVFDGEGGITGDKLLHIGNAIVDLANKGVATGGFIVDFTQRLSGMAKAAGVALPAVIGLAAGFEESGLRVESSATAVQNLLGIMGKNVESFAKIAGKDLSTFAQTIRDNPVEALIELAQSAIKNKTGFAELAPVFKELEANGVRVQQVLATLGAKGDFFRQKIEEAGASLQETGEITEAFALKNDNLSANLSKLSKEFSNVVQSSGIIDFMNSLAKGTINVINTIKQLPAWLEKNKYSLALLTLGIILFNGAMIKSAAVIGLQRAAIIRNNVVKGASIILDKALIAVQLLWRTAVFATAAVVDLLTGNLSRAKVMSGLFATSLKASLGVIGGIIIAVTTLVILYGKEDQATRLLTAKHKALNQVKEEAAKATADEKNQIQSLLAVINNENVAKDTKAKALQKLISLSPDYLHGLTLENTKTQEGIDIVNKYISALDRMARAKASVDLKADLLKEQISASLDNSQKDADYVNYVKTGGSFSESAGQFFKAFAGNSYQQKASSSNNKLQEVNAKLSLLDSINDKQVNELNKQLKIIDQTLKTEKEGTEAYKKTLLKKKETESLLNIYTPGLYGSSDNNTASVGTGSGSFTPATGAPTKSTVNSAKKLKEETKAFALEMKDLKEKLEANGESIDEKEIVAVEQKYEKLLVKAKKYAFDELTIHEMEQKELQQLFEKHFKERSEKEYVDSLKINQDHYNQKRDAANKDFTAGITNAEEYKNLIVKIAEEEKEQKSIIANQYAKTSEKATADRVKFEKNASNEKVQTKLKEIQEQKQAMRQLDREILTISQSKVNVAELTLPKGSKGILEARKNLIEQQFHMDVAGKKESDAMYIQLEKEKNAAINQLDLENFQERFANVMQYVDMFSQAMGSVINFLNAKDDAALAKDKKNNEAKKDHLQKQLDSKLISQSVFDKKTREIQDEQDKKEQEVAKKKAQREKAKSLFDIAINTASAIVEALPNIGLSIAVGILGAIQAATVAATPVPEMGTGGLLRNGPKHKDKQKGLNVVNPETGNTEMLLERGEAVVSAAAIDSDKVYTLRGTTAQITSTLNGMAGGATWASNATFMPSWQKAPQPQINSGMIRVMANGGVIAGLGPKASTENTSTASGSGSAYSNQDVVSELRSLRGDVSKWNSSLKAYVVLKDIDKQRALYEQAQKAGGINQE